VLPFLSMRSVRPDIFRFMLLPIPAISLIFYFHHFIQPNNFQF